MKELGKFRLTVKTSYGEIAVEGDSLIDFKNSLTDLGISESDLSNVLNAIVGATKQKLQEPFKQLPISVAPSKPEFRGVIEYTSDGTPHLTVSPERLTAKTVIGLLLYAKDPNPISIGELTELVNLNWKNVDTSYISANLAYMRPLVVKMGERRSYSYVLSGFGKSWVENEILQKLKAQGPKS